MTVIIVTDAVRLQNSCCWIWDEMRCDIFHIFNISSFFFFMIQSSLMSGMWNVHPSLTNLYSINFFKIFPANKNFSSPQKLGFRPPNSLNKHVIYSTNKMLSCTNWCLHKSPCLCSTIFQLISFLFSMKNE